MNVSFGGLLLTVVFLFLFLGNGKFDCFYYSHVGMTIRIFLCNKLASSCVSASFGCNCFLGHNR